MAPKPGEQSGSAAWSRGGTSWRVCRRDEIFGSSSGGGLLPRRAHHVCAPPLTQSSRIQDCQLLPRRTFAKRFPARCVGGENDAAPAAAGLSFARLRIPRSLSLESKPAVIAVFDRVHLALVSSA
jgi:hypothetical protein